MALIKQAEADRIASGVPINLADVSRQADLIRQAAADEAERVIAEARRRAEGVESGAAEEGRQRGYREGLEQGRIEGYEAGRAEAFGEHAEALAEVEAGWRAGLEALVQQRESLVGEARRDLLRLAVLAAEKITKRAIEVDPSIVKDQMYAALSMATRPSGARVAVHPEDLPLAREALPRLLERIAGADGVELIEDEALERGSCVVRGAGGEAIDASVRTQIDRIVAALLPDEDGGAHQSEPAA